MSEVKPWGAFIRASKAHLYIGISRSELARWVTTGKLCKSHRIGDSRMRGWRREELDACLDRALGGAA